MGLEKLRGCNPEDVASKISNLHPKFQAREQKICQEACFLWFAEQDNLWGGVFADELQTLRSPDVQEETLNTLHQLENDSADLANYSIEETGLRLGELYLRSPLPSVVLTKKDENIDELTTDLGLPGFIIGSTQEALGFEKTIVFRIHKIEPLPQNYDAKYTHVVFGFPHILTTHNYEGHWHQLMPNAMVAIGGFNFHARGTGRLEGKNWVLAATKK